MKIRVLFLYGGDSVEHEISIISALQAMDGLDTERYEAIPCYICIIAMPFFYSISEGIAMGVISYVVLNLVTGKAKGRISVLMYVLAVLFVLKYLFL